MAKRDKGRAEINKGEFTNNWRGKMWEKKSEQLCPMYATKEQKSKEIGTFSLSNPILGRSCHYSLVGTVHEREKREKRGMWCGAAADGRRDKLTPTSLPVLPSTAATTKTSQPFLLLWLGKFPTVHAPPPHHTPKKSTNTTHFSQIYIHTGTKVLTFL